MDIAFMADADVSVFHKLIVILLVLDLHLFEKYQSYVNLNRMKRGKVYPM